MAGNRDNIEEPAIPEFVQTARAQIEELDRWQQITEEEAHLAYEMTMRNELSGGTKTVREFERRWQLSFHDTMMSQIVLTRNLEKGQVYIHKHHLRLNLPGRKQNLNIRFSIAEKIKDLFDIDPQFLEKALTSLEEERTILTRHQ